MLVFIFRKARQTYRSCCVVLGDGLTFQPVLAFHLSLLLAAHARSSSAADSKVSLFHVPSLSLSLNENTQAAFLKHRYEGDITVSPRWGVRDVFFSIPTFLL